MAYEFYSPLAVRSGFLSGMLGGKLLNCLISPSLPGSVPAAGVYQIQPPMVDIVFGQLAVMTLVSQAAGGVSVSNFEEFVRQGSGASAESLEWAPQGGGASAFVLSSRQIPGRNCVVVQNGFADLMEALKVAGGARVRFV